MATTDNLGDMEFLLTRVAYSAAPTILDRKPSTLMSFSQGSRNFYLLWEQFKVSVSTILGLEYIELRNEGSSRLVLFYRRNILSVHLHHRETSQFLADLGYPKSMDIAKCLEMLKSGFASLCPHEVGVFLGIPLADVKAYIEYGGQGALACKYWKVYDNLDSALHTFAQYDEARHIIVNSFFSALRMSSAA